MEDFEQELKFDFLEEATQLLENTEQFFLQLESDPNNPDLLNEIFRFAHNLKGTSRAVGFGGVAEFTHEVENLILKLKEGEVQINEPVVSILLDCNDHIAVMVEGLKENFDAVFDSEELIGELIIAVSNKYADGSARGENGSGETAPTAEEIAEGFEENNVVEDIIVEAESEISDENIETLDLDALEQLALANHHQMTSEENDSKKEEITDENLKTLDLDALEQLALANHHQMTSQGNNSKKEETAEDMAFKVGDQPLAEVVQLPKKEAPKKEEIEVASRSAAKKAPKEDESIRVSLSRVESLNNFVGELVILQTVLSQRTQTHVEDELAIKTISQLGKISKEIQSLTMSLRMVPVKNTLQKMNRIIRDTSKALDKKVNLTLIGEETEIDKTVLEHLADPLVHIVRNAVDHGLEATADRELVNKNDVGNITIHAFHEGNNLVIEVKDDGKGIDHNIIKRKAIEKGVIKSNSTISDNDAVQLIFHPGFSTKDEVSEVSGRGVGMDVVKTNIEKLSGKVFVNTKIGEGSVFRIVLPLTMAIVEGMVVEVGADKYIIPITQVQESLRPSINDLHTVEGVGECISLRGDVLPIYRISHLLKMNAKDNRKMEDMITIVVNTSKKRYAVAIDDISHQQQVVIKNLGNEIKDSQGFIGSSILGDGKPSFILDLDELVEPVVKNLSKMAA